MLFLQHYYWFCVLKRKLGIEDLEVVGSRATWRNYVCDIYEEGWQEGEIWSRVVKLAKEDFGEERYVREFGGKGEVRFR